MIKKWGSLGFWRVNHLGFVAVKDRATFLLLVPRAARRFTNEISHLMLLSLTHSSLSHLGKKAVADNLSLM